MLMETYKVILIAICILIIYFIIIPLNKYDHMTDYNQYILTQSLADSSPTIDANINTFFHPYGYGYNRNGYGYNYYNHNLDGKFIGDSYWPQIGEYTPGGVGYTHAGR